MTAADPATTRTARSKTLWLLAGIAVLLVLWNGVERRWGDAAGYACLAVAMIINATADVKGKQWPRVAVVALVVLAVTLWILW